MAEVRRLLRFEVLERLGAGDGSTVYRVADAVGGKVFALKHGVRRGWWNSRAVTELENEFRVGRFIVHPNLRRICEIEMRRDWLGRGMEAFLVMGYVPGQTLEEDPPKSVGEVIAAFLQLAHGLKALHETGHVHGDLSFANVLRSGDGHITLIDCGRSCVAGTVGCSLPDAPEFAAPKQRSREPVTVQTDVYCLGAMLYRCLTGRPVPTGVKHVEEPMEINPAISLPLSNLVMDCIAVRPQRRPRDMDQVIARLELARHLGPGGAGVLAVLRPRGPDGLAGHAGPVVHHGNARFA